jgi:hypothetical protein
MAYEKRRLTIGLSPAPTLYKIHWHGGNEEYVYCGADILLNGLEGDLEGEAICPVCKNHTQLVITDGKIESLDRHDAAIHVVEIPANTGRIWIECEATHIFDNKECLEKWISGYSGRKGIVASVQQYHKQLAARRTSREKPPEYLAKLDG